ncbi:MAG TPA: general secretion pathway protein GspB [Steroidobacteraceae bacterium]|jgi:general secretion pathway protein B|nr:general secretion pathway protein GspB [Steroidobacteraceae bacterium]
MSFILDALKKSESERKRQGGPALLEMRVSPPRRGLPMWAVLIAIALLANLGILAYLLLRQPETTAVAVPVTAPAVATAPGATPPALAPAAPPAAATPPASTLPDPATVTSALPPANAADYEPAVPPRPAVNGVPSNATIAGDMGLPTMQDLNASGAGIPGLRLSLHAYDPNPANRYVLLNSARMREGETTAEGVRLERITEFGVVMSWRGRRFTLMRGE